MASLLVQLLLNPVTLFLLAMGAVWTAGYTEAVMHDHVKEVRAELAEAQREAKAAKAVAADTEVREAQVEKANQALQEKVNAYIHESLKRPPAAACTADRGDAAGLHAIGAPEAKSATPAKHVRKAAPRPRHSRRR